MLDFDILNIMLMLFSAQKKGLLSELPDEDDEVHMILP